MAQRQVDERNSLARLEQRSEAQEKHLIEINDKLGRLGFIEAEFDPIPVDAGIARTWASLASICVARGLQPRRRAMDLLIAATAKTLNLGLPLTLQVAADEVIE